MPLLTSFGSTRGLGFGALSESESSYELIAEGTINSGTSFTVTNIPTNYFGLVVLFNGSVASNTQQLYPTFKTSTGSNIGIRGKGMTGQTWSWRQGTSTSIYPATLAVTAMEMNTYTTTNGGYTGGFWQQNLPSPNATYAWSFSAGSIYGSTKPSQVTFETSGYPASYQFSNCRYTIYGIVGL